MYSTRLESASLSSLGTGVSFALPLDVEAERCWVCLWGGSVMSSIANEKTPENRSGRRFPGVLIRPCERRSVYSAGPIRSQEEGVISPITL